MLLLEQIPGYKLRQRTNGAGCRDPLTRPSDHRPRAFSSESLFAQVPKRGWFGFEHLYVNVLCGVNLSSHFMPSPLPTFRRDYLLVSWLNGMCALDRSFLGAPCELVCQQQTTRRWGNEQKLELENTSDSRIVHTGRKQGNIERIKYLQTTKKIQQKAKNTAGKKIRIRVQKKKMLVVRKTMPKATRQRKTN